MFGRHFLDMPLSYRVENSKVVQYVRQHFLE
jgi:hypothetical protein